jgi:hypothetical protein
MANRQLNLLLKLRIHGEADARVRCATRVGVDAGNGLMLTDA